MVRDGQEISLLIHLRTVVHIETIVDLIVNHISQPDKLKLKKLLTLKLAIFDKRRIPEGGKNAGRQPILNVKSIIHQLRNDAQF